MNCWNSSPFLNSPVHDHHMTSQLPFPTCSASHLVDVLPPFQFRMMRMRGTDLQKVPIVVANIYVRSMGGALYGTLRSISSTICGLKLYQKTNHYTTTLPKLQWPSIRQGVDYVSVIYEMKKEGSNFIFGPPLIHLPYPWVIFAKSGGWISSPPSLLEAPSFIHESSTKSRELRSHLLGALAYLRHFVLSMDHLRDRGSRILSLTILS